MVSEIHYFVVLHLSYAELLPRREMHATPGAGSPLRPVDTRAGCAILVDTHQHAQPLPPKTLHMIVHFRMHRRDATAWRR